MILCLIVLSCNNSNKGKKETVEIKNEENFYSFFANISFSQEFLTSRTKIPNIGFKDIHPELEYKFEISNSQTNDLSKDDKDLISIKHLTKITLNDSLIIDYVFKKIDSKWYLIENHTVSENNYINKSFLTFLKNFSSDSVYRKNHIKYPLKHEYLNDEFSKQVKYLDENEVIKYNFFETGYLIFLNDGIELGNNINITISGIANGIYVYYGFEIVDGEWKLIEHNDYST